jgi:DNA repair protein RadC
MAVRQITDKLYSDIKKDFDKLSSIKELGVKKFTTEFILAKLADQYYKSPKTIENIVFNRVANSNKAESSQLLLFVNQQ